MCKLFDGGILAYGKLVAAAEMHSSPAIGRTPTTICMETGSSSSWQDSRIDVQGEIGRTSSIPVWGIARTPDFEGGTFHGHVQQD